MRACTDRLVSIVTIAANLDPASWAQHHGYTPLGDLPELYKAAHAKTNPHETHWQCRDDEIVPPSVTDAYFAARPDVTRIIVGNCTHSTGWGQYWKRIVKLSTEN